MQEINVTWGSAIKVAWSIGWRVSLYLIPAYIIGAAVMLGAMMSGDMMNASIVTDVLAYYLLELLWLAYGTFAFVLAVKQVIGRSYSASAFPPVAQAFRVTLVAGE